MGSATTCGYEFDPEESEQVAASEISSDAEFLNQEDVWSCPHRSYESSENCIFHTPDIRDDTAARKLFLSTLADSATSAAESSPHRFIGAQIEALPLSNVVIEAPHTHPIDFRYSRIGVVDLEHAEILVPLNLTGSTIGTLEGHNAEFGGRLECLDGTIENCRVESAQFRERTLFSRTQFSRVNFFNTVFDERVLFTDCTFTGYSLFKNTDFHHTVDFSRTEWRNKSTFSKSTFQRLAKFEEITVDSRLTISDSDFLSDMSIKLSDIQPEDTMTIDLSGSMVSGGELRPPNRGDMIFDLTDTTLGDVRLLGTSPIDLTQYRFVNTSFDGFDFSEYTESLVNVNWYFHIMNDGSSLSGGSAAWSSDQDDNHQYPEGFEDLGSETDTDSISPGTLRSTYLRAKNGAKAVGDDTASAEFFLREMKFKRKVHFEKFRTDRSLKGLQDWISNWFYNVTAGYGERPGRTFIMSIIFIFLFANMYALRSPESYSAGHVFEYLEFSVQAFVALVLGTPSTTLFPGLAAAEAFIGSFMIALFVFTLTRSIHR